MNNSRVAQDLKIEKVLTQFELAWRKEDRPEIEEWLGRYVDLDRKKLFRELLICEIDLRKTDSGSPICSEYVQKFPKFESLIVDVFLHEFSDSTSGSNPVANDQTVAADGSTERRAKQERGVGDHCSSLPASQIGSYQLIERVGRGGMGDVFRAFDIKLKREVAIKLIHRDGTKDEILLKRFEREANTVAKLEHAGIVPVFDYGFDNDSWYIVMPLLQGGTLGEPWPTRTFDRRTFLAKIAVVVDALQYAHEQGVIHRDIKPRNILLDNDYQPKLCDFGLAKVVGGEGLTMTSQVFGTPAYMSPEQLERSGNVGPGTDIHAVGAILYKEFTGRIPYHADTFEAVAIRIREDTPLSIRETDTTIDRDLETITMKCLAKRPQDRYVTAAALADDLRRFLEGRPVKARPVNGAVRLYRWSLRKPVLATLIGTACILALVSMAAALMFYQNASQSKQIANFAEQRRVKAVAATEQERTLREMAEVALADARDAAKLAEAQQYRATFKSIQMAKRLGNFGEAAMAVGNLTELGGSLDSEWLQREFAPVVNRGDSIPTANWGLYDQAIDPQRKLLATADRAGQLIVWSLETELPVRKLVVVDKHPESARLLPRWKLFDGDKKDPATTIRKLKFFSSLAWKSDTQIWTTDHEGALSEFEVGTGRRKLIRQSDEPFSFVRFNSARDKAVVINASGKVDLLDSAGELIRSMEFGQAVSHAIYSSELDAWIFGGFEGKLSLLSVELEELESIDMNLPIHDARAWRVGNEVQILGTVGSEPIFRFSVSNRDKIELKRMPDLDQPDRAEGCEFRQVIVDQAKDQIVALDTSGRLGIWSLPNSRFQLAISKMPRRDIRAPGIDRRRSLDPLEARTCWFLNLGMPHVEATDCMGTFRRFDLSKTTDPIEWESLKTSLGKEPRLAYFRENAGRVWSLNKDGKLMVVSMAKDAVLAEVENAHAGGRADILVLRNGDVVTAGGDQYLKLWRYVAGEIRELRRIEGPHELLSVAVQEDVDFVASVNAKGNVNVWKWSNGELLHTLAFDDGEPVKDESRKDLPIKILTGEIAFSDTGKYLAAFGSWQDFTVFETETFKMVPCRWTNNAGDGGIAFAFSPTVEHRYIFADTISPSAGVLATDAYSADEKIKSFFSSRLRGKSGRMSEFVKTHDGLRMVGLSPRRISFRSPDHFVLMGEIPCPVSSEGSIAIGEADSTIAVADKDGALHWCEVKPSIESFNSGQTLNGIVHWLQQSDTLPSERLFTDTYYYLQSDSDENLAKTLYAGSGEVTSPLRKLHVLRKRNGIWNVDALKFDGDTDGPIVAAKLFRAPDGKLVSVIRQGQPELGAYSGRVLLAYESDDLSPWKTEVVQTIGNTGFYPYVLFDQKGRVESLIHFDHWYQRLLMATRGKMPGDWSTKPLVGGEGVELRGSVTSDGRHQFLMRRLLGWDSIEPTRFASWPPDAKFTTLPGKGKFPFVMSDQRVVSFDPENGEVYVRNEDGSWSLIAKNNHTKLRNWPAMLQGDKLAWCRVDGRSVTMPCLDLKLAIEETQKAGQAIDTGHSAWRVHQIKLDDPIAEATETALNITKDGRLQTMLYRQGSGAYLAVVESVEKFNPDSKGVADGN
jgi:WD40 repeat protein